MTKPSLNHYFWIISAFIAVLLAGCTLYEDNGVSKSEDYDGVKLTISSPKQFYEKGETVAINIVLENTTSETVILKNNPKSSDYAFDVLVDGTYLSSVYPELAVHELELKPGEKVEIDYSYTPPANATGVTVNAYTYNSDGTAQERMRITIFYGEHPAR